MKKTQEKGVTLVALVITIVALLIILSITVNSGMPTIEISKFNQFKYELKVLQTKVNELNQNNEIEIGIKELTQEQKEKITRNIKNIDETIISDFRYCDKTYIQNELGLQSVERDYLINVKNRYVISVEGFEYEGTTYYMINQLPDGVYNVEYNDKNPKTGEFSFDVNSVKEGDKWKIEVSNIEYPGYINNWKVQYREADETTWKTVNGLSFYVKKQGNYYVRVVYEDINLGSKLVTILEETNIVDEIENTL